MKKFIRSISVLISIVLGLFWIVGLFAVEKSEIPFLVAVAVITESIPVLIAVLMKRSIRKGDRYAQEAKARASVPIWEKNEEEKSSVPSKGDVAEKIPAPVIPEIPEEPEPESEPEPMKPTEPPAEEPVQGDSPEEPSVDEEADMERLRRTMTRAVNEAVELHGFAYAVHMSKVEPDVAKGQIGRASCRERV